MSGVAGPLLTHVPYAAFAADVRMLAEALTADAGWRPRYIVGIGRGGLTPAVFLSHASGHPLLSLDLSSHVPAFGGDLLATLAAFARDGDNLLFVDDINDSGATIAGLRAALRTAGAPAVHIRFATLLSNIRSIVAVDYAARTIDRAVTKDWFVFPWEAMATEAANLADAAEVPERTA